MCSIEKRNQIHIKVINNCSTSLLKKNNAYLNIMKMSKFSPRLISHRICVIIKEKSYAL